MGSILPPGVGTASVGGGSAEDQPGSDAGNAGTYDHPGEGGKCKAAHTPGRTGAKRGRLEGAEGQAHHQMISLNFRL